MKISINAILAGCILCYFRYFLQLTLELLLILFILIGFLKKILIVLSLILTLKQRFIKYNFFIIIKLINEKSQTN